MIVQEYEVIVQAHTAHWDQVKKENPEFDFLFGTLTITTLRTKKIARWLELLCYLSDLFHPWNSHEDGGGRLSPRTCALISVDDLCQTSLCVLPLSLTNT